MFNILIIILTKLLAFYLLIYQFYFYYYENYIINIGLVSCGMLVKNRVQKTTHFCVDSAKDFKNKTHN